jgi:RNA polymerase-binding transcription factor DksA
VTDAAARVTEATDEGAIDSKTLLEEERATLRHELAELGFADEGHGLDYDSNFADTSQVTAERGEAEVLAGQLRETLVEVEEALGKLESGTYGTCDLCGKPITPARLEAKPASRYCIDCASKRR